MAKWCNVCHRNEMTGEWNSCNNDCPVFGKSFDDLAKIEIKYNYLVSHYYVDVYKHAILNEWLKYKTEKFNNVQEAIAYAKHEVKHGNHARVYEISKVTGWE